MQLRISRNNIAIAIGIVVVLGAIAGIIRYRFHSQKGGPLLRYAVGKHVETWTQNGMNATVNEHIFLGSFPFENQGNSPIKILSVMPKNTVSGVSILQPVFLSVPPGFGSGPLSWLTKQENSNAIHPIPVTLAPSKSYEPGLEAVVNKKGIYVINGLVIKYKVHRRIYKAYFRSQFVVNVGNKPLSNTQLNNIAPPPQNLR